MSETEKKDHDHGIRLFGRKIPLPECRIKDACSSTKKTEAEIPCAENTEQQENSSDSRDSSKQNPQHDNNVHESEPIVNSKPMEDNMEIGNTDQDKILKKPDKILQCPRCSSLDTKFCYFNNYNVNQPRHFCKNCQRYWTAGGTMRNVPIGAGRRKNKHLASQYRQIIVTSDDGIPTSRLETTVLPDHQHISSLSSSDSFRSMTENGTILKFGPDTPICKSMKSMLSLRDQKICADATSNSIGTCVEYKEEQSLCVSSVTNSGTQGNESTEHNTSNWLKCYPVPPWVVPWNPSWNSVVSTAAIPYSTNPTPLQWCPTPILPIQGVSPPNIPLQQLVSAPYWSGGPLLIGSTMCVSPYSSTSTSCFKGNGSNVLGKHTRDTFWTDEEVLEKSALVQNKTIRIDDKDVEASKSPIRATLAIKM